MTRQCPTPTRNGDRCSGSVPENKYHCWFHDPANSDKRRRAASRGGKGKKSRTSRDLHALLSDLTEQVIAGLIDPYPASVAGSLIGVRLRLMEFERKAKETDEVVERLAALEDVASKQGRGPGPRSISRGAQWGD